MLQEPMLQQEAMYTISYEFHAYFVSAETIRLLNLCMCLCVTPSHVHNHHHLTRGLFQFM